MGALSGYLDWVWRVENESQGGEEVVDGQMVWSGGCCALLFPLLVGTLLVCGCGGLVAKAARRLK